MLIGDPRINIEKLLSGLPEQEVRPIMREIIAESVKEIVNIFNSGEVSIILTGSLARGELVYQIKGKSAIILSDLDLVVVAGQTENQELLLQEALSRLKLRFQKVLPCGMEIKILPPSFFDDFEAGLRSDLGIYFLDLYRSGETVFGKEILKRIRGSVNSKVAIPRKCIRRFLCHAINLRLRYYFPEKANFEDPVLVGYHSAKAIIDLQRVFLANYGILTFSRQETSQEFFMYCEKHRFANELRRFQRVGPISLRYLSGSDMHLIKQEAGVRSDYEAVNWLWRNAVKGFFSIYWHIFGFEFFNTTPYSSGSYRLPLKKLLTAALSDMYRYRIKFQTLALRSGMFLLQ